MRLYRMVPLLLTGLLAGCYGWRAEPVSPAQFVSQTRPERVQVTRTDRTKVQLYTPTVVGDSLRGFPTEKAIRPIVVPLDEAATVSTRRFSLTRTLGLVVALGGGLLLYDWLMSLNQVQ